MIVFVVIWFISCWICTCNSYGEHSAIFDPQGRLQALDRASRAIDQHGGPVCALIASDGIFVILATPRSSTKESILVISEEVQKVSLVHRSLLVGKSGHLGQLQPQALTALHQRHQMKYGQPIPLETLCQEVADVFNVQCRTAGALPVRCQLMLCGHDDELGFQVYVIHPDGSYDGWNGIAIGKDSQMISRSIAKLYEEGGSQQQSVAKLWPALQKDILRKYFLPPVQQDGDGEDDDKHSGNNKHLDYDVEVYLLSKASLHESEEEEEGEAGEEETEASKGAELTKPRWRKLAIPGVHRIRNNCL